MKFKKIIVSALGTGLTIIMSTTAFAAGWQQNDPGWRWQNDDGTWPANTWQWLDDDNDGISKCYYFDENGYLLTAATTPDGYTVNENGAWVIDGNEQTLSAGSSADRTVHDGKFNKDGVNAVAYDLLMHTREENAEKYIETDKKTYGGHYFYEKCEYRVSYNDDQSANEVFIWAYEDDSIWAEKFNSKLSDVFVDAPKKVFYNE